MSGSSLLAAPIVAHSPAGRSGRPVLDMGGAARSAKFRRGCRYRRRRAPSSRANAPSCSAAPGVRRGRNLCGFPNTPVTTAEYAHPPCSSFRTLALARSRNRTCIFPRNGSRTVLCSTAGGWPSQVIFTATRSPTLPVLVTVTAPADFPHVPTYVPPSKGTGGPECTGIGTPGPGEGTSPPVWTPHPAIVTEARAARTSLVTPAAFPAAAVPAGNLTWGDEAVPRQRDTADRAGPAGRPVILGVLVPTLRAISISARTYLMAWTPAATTDTTVLPRVLTSWPPGKAACSARPG